MSVALRRPTIFATRRSRTVAFGASSWPAVARGRALTRRPARRASTSADAFWSRALVAVLATFGATRAAGPGSCPPARGARRGLGGGGVRAVAILIAFVSVLRDTRSRAWGALVAALGGIALLRAGPVGFHGLSALLSAGAVVPVVVSGCTTPAGGCRGAPAGWRWWPAPPSA